MRGKLIKYDRRILNAFLRTSPASSSQVMHFSEFLSGHKEHDEIASTLGTYMLGVSIMDDLQNNACKLEELGEQLFPRTWSAEHLKIHYN